MQRVAPLPSSKYTFTDDMGSITQLGELREYEYRNIILAGCKWIEQNPKSELNMNTLIFMFGEDRSNTSVHKVKVCTKHIIFIKNHGWDKYADTMKMRKMKRDQIKHSISFIESRSSLNDKKEDIVVEYASQSNQPLPHGYSIHSELSSVSLNSDTSDEFSDLESFLEADAKKESCTRCIIL